MKRRIGRPLQRDPKRDLEYLRHGSRFRIVDVPGVGKISFRGTVGPANEAAVSLKMLGAAMSECRDRVTIKYPYMKYGEMT